jgi:hypothetical protein
MNDALTGHLSVENELRPATERLETLPPDLRVER